MQTKRIYKCFVFWPIKAELLAIRFIYFENLTENIKMELSKDEIHVLRVLYNSGCWGKGAMYARNIVYKGSPEKTVKKLEKELRLISKFKHKHGWKYFLIKERRPEIEEILGIQDIRKDIE